MIQVQRRRDTQFKDERDQRIYIGQHLTERNGVIIKPSKGIGSKYVCNKCHKALISNIEEFNEMCGDVEIPTVLDHLTQLRLFQRVK